MPQPAAPPTHGKPTTDNSTYHRLDTPEAMTAAMEELSRAGYNPVMKTATSETGEVTYTVESEDGSIVATSNDVLVLDSTGAPSVVTEEESPLPPSYAAGAVKQNPVDLSVAVRRHTPTDSQDAWGVMTLKAGGHYASSATVAEWTDLS